MTFSLFETKICVNAQDIEMQRKKTLNYIITGLLARRENRSRFMHVQLSEFPTKIVTTRANGEFVRGSIIINMEYINKDIARARPAPSSSSSLPSKG